MLRAGLLKTQLLIGLAAGGGALFLLTRKQEEPGPLPSAIPRPDDGLDRRDLDRGTLSPDASFSEPVDVPTLDTGLSLAEAAAVSYALVKETAFANLDGFANAFEPTYPVAASLLRGKAMLLGSSHPLESALANAVRVPVARSTPTPLQPAAQLAQAKASWARPIPVSLVAVRVAGAIGDAKPTLPPSPFYALIWPAWARDTVPAEWSGDVEKLIGDRVPRGDGAGWQVGTESRLQLSDLLTNLQTIGLARMLTGERAWGGGNPLDAGGLRELGQLVEEEMKKVGAVIGPLLKALAPIVGLIPGIGSGIAVAMSVAGSLAMGQNISDALIDAAANAIPGAGLVKMAIETAATAGKDLIKGKSIGDLGMDVMRKNIESQGGPLAAAAFDAGVALVQGKNLQDAGFQIYYGWVKGNEAAERAGHFAETVARAVRDGKAVKDVLLDTARDELVRAIPSSLERAKGIDAVINALRKDDSLLAGSIEDAAQKIGVAVEHAQAAFMCVKHMGDGVVVVDPEIRKRFDSVVLMPDRPLLTTAMQNRIAEFAMARPKIDLSNATVVQPAKTPNLIVVKAASPTKDGPKLDTSPGGSVVVSDAELAAKVVSRAMWVTYYQDMRSSEGAAG